MTDRTDRMGNGQMEPSEPEMVQNEPTVEVEPLTELPAESLPEVAGSPREGLVCTCGQTVIPAGKTKMGIVPSVFGEPGYVHRIPEEVIGEVRLEDGTKVKDVTNGGGPCHELT